MRGLIQGLNRITRIVEEKGVCPLCLENRDEEVDLEEVTVKEIDDKVKKVKANCPECSFASFKMVKKE